MKIQLYPVELPLEYEFTIARGSMTTQRSLIVALEHDGRIGYGESTENAYYGYTLNSMAQSIERWKPLVEDYHYASPAELWQLLYSHDHDDTFALSAVDLAAHDLFGKLAGQRTYEMLGLKWDDIVDSSYTIGIDIVEKMVSKLQENVGWSVYKIKLGAGHDVEIIRELRRHTTATFRVDANCGWSVNETIANSHVLKTLGVEFIEQPLPADASAADQQRVYAESALPVIADENCLVESDVAKCHEQFHGINVKLCKCGGLTPAVRMLQKARSLGMKTMIGCMVESSVGISAAAQLLPLLDYADLDGANLLADEPASGVTVNNGRIAQPNEFGTGVSLSCSRLGYFSVENPRI